ncbi:MAG: HlyD family efflux transporter periplasmic adaptor subunit [Eubacteriales bacterium]|nr:HlyD family efflux transporter periplasmic adaptor subunit [Eubacteriales bacterium]
MAEDNKRRNEPGTMAGFFVQIRKIFGLNIGTIIFGILFLYMVFSAIMYFTSSHIDAYQVTSGPLSRNETYTGLALRTETICKADSGGYVNYYAREGNKIHAGGAVYGLSATKVPESETTLSQEELSRIRSDMQSFSKGFSPCKFNSTYSFKYQLEGSILQYAGLSAPVTESGVVTLGNQNITRSPCDGIVLYSCDGYEEKTAEGLTLGDFDQTSYHETDLKTQSQVKTGDNIYTIITDERWSLVIPLTDKQASKLADRTYIRVKFLKDNMTQSGDFSILEMGGLKYGKIDFNRGLIRYASDRFLDIELVTNTVSGLKIPLSSIVTKEFFAIPSAFVHENGNSSEVGFMKADKNKDGKSITTYVTPRIYARIEDPSAPQEPGSGKTAYIYYVDKSDFKEGDAIMKAETGGRFIVGPTEILEGVYCINQGYAVFRRVEILDQNEEYAIVAKGTSYGLARYDHIVREASRVREEDILY